MFFLIFLVKDNILKEMGGVLKKKKHLRIKYDSFKVISST